MMKSDLLAIYSLLYYRVVKLLCRSGGRVKCRPAVYIYVLQKGRLRLTTPAVSHVTPFTDVSSSKAAQFSLYSVSLLIKDLELQTVLVSVRSVCVLCVLSHVCRCLCVTGLWLCRSAGGWASGTGPVPKLEAFYLQKKQQPSQVSESHERWLSVTCDLILDIHTNNM